MQFEWDEAKNFANHGKHGIWFQDAVQIFDGPVLTEVDHREDYGEPRYISYGHLGSLVIAAVVHTDRCGRTRIISARKANRKERQDYYGHLEGKTRRN